jgi:hypothetical protein
LPTVTAYDGMETSLVYLPCKLNTFRKRVKNVVTRKGIASGD